MADTILFFSFGALIAISAVRVVTARNIFHCALYLAAALFGVAAIFVLLGAYFIAAIQVLVYIGAVVVLTIFVINLTKDITGTTVKLVSLRTIPAIIAGLLGASLFTVVIVKAGLEAGLPALPAADSTEILGRQLLGDFVLPFEIISVLLLAALIAAIAIVSKDREDEK